MNIPTNYKITKLDAARRYLKTFATSLQDTNESEIVFELLNLADRISDRVLELQVERAVDTSGGVEGISPVFGTISAYNTWESDDE